MTSSCCNSSKDDQNLHLPNFFRSYQEIDIENPDIKFQEMQLSKENILRKQLAYLSAQIFESSIQVPSHRQALYCHNPCTLFEETVINIDHIFTATCCWCIPDCTNPKPSGKTYVPKETYEALNESSEYFHRNTGLLCCLTPMIVGLIPWVGLLSGFPQIPSLTTAIVTSVASCFTNIASITMAGCLTYFCSGDFGGVERERERELTEGYNDIAKRIKKYSKREGWEKIIVESCTKITKNMPHIKQAIINQGFKKTNTEMILAKFSKTVLQIHMEMTNKSKLEKESIFELKEVLIETINEQELELEKNESKKDI